MKVKKKKIKKTQEQQSYQFSAESGERYDKWLEEAGKRWRKGVLIISEENIDLLDVDTLAGHQLDKWFESTKDRNLTDSQFLVEKLLVMANLITWSNNYQTAARSGEAGIMALCNFVRDQVLQEIPEMVRQCLSESILPTKEVKQNGTKSNESCQ